MNIVVSGSKVQVYGEEVSTYKQLPVDTYDVCFHKLTGFWLTPRPNLNTKEEKIYGSHQKKVDKVLKSFEATDRNFGVILSGKKGIGKSLFARILAESCIQHNLPVIIVTQYIPGIADFLASIKQEVMVIFDEFEKTFSKHDDYDPQEEMLSLFDGLDNGKKLFVITCNQVSELSSYLINRPGRFHYHFTITNPSQDEVREYMTDKLKPEYQHWIEKIVSFSTTINMTYDFLRALAFELNQGYSLDETLSDLNIQRTSDIKFNISITLSDGRLFTAYEQAIDLYSDKKIGCRVYGPNSVSLWFSFLPTDIKSVNNQLVLSPEKVQFVFDDDDYWDLDGEEKKAAIAKDKAIKAKSCIFNKVDTSYVYKYLL